MTSATLVTALLVFASLAVAVLLGFDRSRSSRRAIEREDSLRAELLAAKVAVRSEEQTLEAFRSLAGEALADQSTRLLELADAKYETLERSAEARWSAQSQTVLGRLEQYAQHLGALEKERRDDSGALRGAVDSLKEHSVAVQAEAGNLASALRDNATRGLWGEVQLRRALEASGMMNHADFTEQTSVRTGEGSRRPDVIVRLPNDRVVTIDAKAPLDAFLRAAETEDPAERRTHVEQHGRAVSRHVGELSRRNYDEAVVGSVDFMVLFLPGDPYLSAALEGRPELFEEAWHKRVLLVTPTTLIGLLRGVALGWRERKVTEQAEQIAELGRELHQRVATFANHFVAVGASLGRSVDAYNQSLASMESRLLVTARRFDDLGAGSSQAIPDSDQIEGVPRIPSAEELRGPHHAA